MAGAAVSRDTAQLVTGPWTRQELFRLVDLYAVHSAKRTAELLGRDVASVFSAAKRYGLSKVQQNPRQLWTGQELELLRAQYPHERASLVAAALGRDVDAVHRKARDLGISKTADFFDRERERAKKQAQSCSSMIATRFAKGHEPANKGVRRPRWSCGRMRETQFKKGQKSWRTFPVGHIGPDPEGFLRIKIREPLYTGEPYTEYRPLYAKYVWEQLHGPVPAGHVIRYRDGDRANCAIDNLYLQSRADNARENQMWNSLPRELAHAIALNAALKRKLRKQNAEKE